MDRVKLIYNPYSGENNIIFDLDKVIKVYQKYGYVIDTFRIGFEFSLEEALESLDDSYNHIIIAGGDGTVDNVVNKMKLLNIDLPIAILPTGTANDFAKYIGMSEDVEEACEQILSSSVRNVDLGKINEKYFINVASSGLFTDVSQKTDMNLKNTIGKLAYYIKGMEELPNFRKLKVKVDSEEVCFDGDMYLILIFNGQTAGNLKFAYESEIEDGLLDVIIIKAGMIKDMISLFFKMLKGNHLSDNKGLLYFKTKEVCIYSNEDIVTDIDGERGPKFPLNIKCEKGGLKILGIK
ncbi:MAG: YegS/Rv2252/BmrU family lipid kinase [Clostridiaceae bacterium]